MAAQLEEMRFNFRPLGVQGGQKRLAVGHGHGLVVAGMGEEAGRNVLGDAMAGGAGVDLGLGRLRAQKVAMGDRIGEGGAEQADEGGAGAEAVGAVGEWVGRLPEAGRQGCCEMAAGGKADRAQLVRIDPEMSGEAADDPHRALGVLQGNQRAFFPTLGGQAIEQHETGEAVGCKAPGDLEAMSVERDESEGAAGEDQEARAARLLRSENIERRGRDPLRPFRARRIGPVHHQGGGGGAGSQDCRADRRSRSARIRKPRSAPGSVRR